MFHVKPDITVEKLLRFIRTQGMEVDEGQSRVFAAYHEMLLDWGRKINLYSKHDRERLIARHFLVSCYYAYYLRHYIPGANRILDLGSGAGFPGIIIAILLPKSRVVLLESSRKKSLFLRKAGQNLGLSVTVVNERAERMVLSGAERYSVVVARAVASLPRLIEYGKRLARPGGLLLAMKGSNYRQEMRTEDGRGNKLIVNEIDVSWVMFSEMMKNKVLLSVEL